MIINIVIHVLVHAAACIKTNVAKKNSYHRPKFEQLQETSKPDRSVHWIEEILNLNKLGRRRRVRSSSSDY